MSSPKIVSCSYMCGKAHRGEGTALNGGDWLASSFKYVPAVLFKWHTLGFTVHDINFLCGHRQRYEHPV